ncbi:hypothetical protein J2I47_19845 [Fibrella sp. HMF5335]|uniref:Capsule assembly protein Wzi n=1 Tax=Fibrella rubiginis TaxID=2817060 RepID=A0A939K7N5_9BACT|nr:capsule assembly Wzi family protein [Fibrella rubiginis]MBO0938815.1 hypothetical protein [Fibrella rubiginis]
MKVIVLFGWLLMAGGGAFAQAIPDTSSRPKSLFVEVGGMAASSGRTPFWLRSRQYGIVPLNSPAGQFRVGGVSYLGDPANPRRVHLKLGAEVVANATSAATQLLLPEAYASLRLGGFELYGGRRREVVGLADTLLSTGSYAWSGNALPITKVQLSTRGFVPVGFTRGVLAINALFAHGWFGNADSVQGSFLHQKALFGRLNLLRGRVRIYAGVTHLAQWGGRRKAGTLAIDGQLPNSLKDYWRVITAAQTPGSDSASYTEIDRLNRVGNHLGSMDVALELSGDRSDWYLYYQHPYEDKSGVAFQNMPDGLYGIRWRNKAALTKSGFRLHQLTAELLTTLNQSGFDIKIGSRLYDGADDYFNNYQYSEGWSNQQRVIGTPFITRTADAQPDLANVRGGFGTMYLSNNRVEVLHLGLLGGWPSGVQVRMLLSGSRNYGRPITSDPRLPRSQFSGMVEGVVPVNLLGQSQIRLTIAADQGQWLTNSIGGWLSFRTLLSN